MKSSDKSSLYIKRNNVCLNKVKRTCTHNDAKEHGCRSVSDYFPHGSTYAHCYAADAIGPIWGVLDMM